MADKVVVRSPSASEWLSVEEAIAWIKDNAADRLCRSDPSNALRRACLLSRIEIRGKWEEGAWHNLRFRKFDVMAEFLQPEISAPSAAGRPTDTPNLAQVGDIPQGTSHPGPVCLKVDAPRIANELLKQAGKKYSGHGGRTRLAADVHEILKSRGSSHKPETVQRETSRVYRLWAQNR